MAKAEITITINRSIEDVFAVLSNVENTPKLEEMMTSAGPVGVGSTRRAVVRSIFGRHHCKRGRALVYGTLAVFITAVHVGIVVGIGSLIGSGGKPNLALSILATEIVAGGFQPVRERAQTLANRLVYGKRATPYDGTRVTGSLPIPMAAGDGVG